MGQLQNSKKTINLLLTGAAVTKASDFLCIPFLTLLLIAKTNLHPSTIGLIAGLSPFAGVLGAFLGGQISDLLGRKKVLKFALIGTSCVYFGFALLSQFTFTMIHIFLFAILNFLIGFLNSMFQPVSQALIGDLLPPEERASAYQRRYLYMNIGSAIGPMLGGVLGLIANSIGFVIGGIIYFLYYLYLQKLLENIEISILQKTVTKRAQFFKSVSILKTDQMIQFYLIASIIFMACYSQLETNLSQYLNLLYVDGVKKFSFLLTVNGITIIVFQKIILYFARKWKDNFSFALGAFIFSFGVLLISLQAHNYNFVCLGMVILSIGEILVFPISSQFIDKHAPAHLRGTYFGINSFRQIGFFIGPPIGGFIFQSYGGKILFFMTSLFAILSVAIHLLGNNYIVKYNREEI